MKTLLPPNASPLERALDTSIGLDALPVPITALWDADTCPEHALPWLAWALHVDDYESLPTVASKRHAIRTSLEFHRKKGTVWALKNALEALGGHSEVIEWFAQSPPGAPYTFSVEHTPDLASGDFILTGDLFERMIQRIHAAKNVRSHLDAVRLVLSAAPAPVYLGAITAAADVVDLYPYQPDALEYPTPLFAALGTVSHEIINIHPMEVP